jgi:O-acetyl-ADP-ribose deacetylase (regulator of RNase III)
MKNKLQVVKGDITQLKVDAIVNAANTTLLGGGGVDGAIHRAAGPGLLEECKKFDGCGIGQSKLTKAYDLPSQYVIHTVGPVWRGGAKGEPQLLASCYATSLELASQNGIKTIAFPCLSCGINGYPISQATMIAVKETANFLELDDTIDTVYFVCIDEPIYEAYLQALSALEDD